MARPVDTRPPAELPPAVMLAAIEAYEGTAVLRFPDLDYRRLSHAVRAGIQAQAAILAQQMRKERP
jgi:hypothetical protein